MFLEKSENKFRLFKTLSRRAGPLKNFSEETSLIFNNEHLKYKFKIIKLKLVSLYSYVEITIFTDLPLPQCFPMKRIQKHKCHVTEPT